MNVFHWINFGELIFRDFYFFFKFLLVDKENTCNGDTTYTLHTCIFLSLDEVYIYTKFIY